MELPVQYQETMKVLLGTEYEEYEKSLALPGYRGIRINTAKMDAEKFEKISPFPCVKIPWISNGYYIPLDAEASRHPYYAAGLYYLQEPSAMTPAQALPVYPGDRVLDLCAAPGGKATELAARLKGTGLLVANDISNSRAKGLLKNLELFGLPNILVTSETPEKLAEYFPAFFDKILVDAPCSGEGMFRKDASMIKSWQEHGPKDYVPLQQKILRSAVRMLRPGGTLLYSTCTFHPAENEGNVQTLLEAEPRLSLVLPEPDLVKLFKQNGFCPGRPDLLDNPNPLLTRCFRIYPHRVNGEGHFFALLQKEGKRPSLKEPADSLSEPKKSEKQKKTGREGKKDLEPLFQFLAQLNPASPLACLRMPPSSNTAYVLKIFQNQVYALPAGLPNLQGLRFLRTGCFLGELAKKRFEPSQAMAMALRKTDWPLTIDLAPTDTRLLRYLKGETLEEPPISRKAAADNPAAVKAGGWCLVCTDTFPLGWGKLVNGSLRNKYYPGWRW